MRPLLFVVYGLLTCFIGVELANCAYSPLLYAAVTLPGTFLHECAHYVMALLLDGHPSGFNLIPSGDTLGSVNVQPTWFNAASIGCAPLLLAPMTGFFIVMATRAGIRLRAFLYIYLASCSWAACIPSSQDFQIAAAFPQSWPIAIVLLVAMTLMWFIISRRLLRTSVYSHGLL